jgi:hypothetical protein
MQANRRDAELNSFKFGYIFDRSRLDFPYIFIRADALNFKIYSHVHNIIEK